MASFFASLGVMEGGFVSILIDTREQENFSLSHLEAVVKLTVSRSTSIWDCPGPIEDSLRNRLTFPNPAFEEKERRGYWTGGLPRELCFLKKWDGAIVFPRGFTRNAISILRKHGARFTLDDRRRMLPEVDFQFQGTLRPFQQEAVDSVVTRDFGVLQAPTGAGKTVMALSVIAARRQPALVIVHTKELVSQWIERIETFFGIPADEVGVIGNGKQRIGSRLTVATVQSLYRCAGEVSPHIGLVVADECHRAPNRTFTGAVSAFDSKYMLGLSATPWRRDGLTRLIYWHLGDRVHEVSQDELLANGSILHAEVITRWTEFSPTVDPCEQYSTMLSELCEDYDRNSLIVTDVVQEARNGSGAVLVLSDRKSHCEVLVRMLEHREIVADLLTGHSSTKHRARVVEKVNAGRSKVLVATGQLIGEGFDCRALSVLFLATPIKFSGRVIHYLGRVLRPAPGKDYARVYDYVDPVGVLEAAARSRARVFRETGHLPEPKQGRWTMKEDA